MFYTPVLTGKVGINRYKLFETRFLPRVACYEKDVLTVGLSKYKRLWSRCGFSVKYPSGEERGSVCFITFGSDVAAVFVLFSKKCWGEASRFREITAVCRLRFRRKDGKYCPPVTGTKCFLREGDHKRRFDFRNRVLFFFRVFLSQGFFPVFDLYPDLIRRS